MRKSMNRKPGPYHSSLITHNLFPHDHRLSFKAIALLVLFSLIVFLPGFSTLPPVDRDEARFAQASKQMLQTGELVDIRFQEDARHKKPVGIYWLQAGTVKLWQLFTEDTADNRIWLYRLPSLAGALMAVLFTALIGTKLFHSRIGMAAGLLMATCLLLNVEARLAKTDAMLLACILACQYVMAKAYNQLKPLKAKDFFIFWSALALGILIKGPIILLPVLGTLLLLALWKEPLGFVKKLSPLKGLLFTALLVLPWFVLITLKTQGEFYHESAGRDLLAKIWEGQNWGGAPPGLYLIAVWGTFWPASLPLLLALPWVWNSRREKPQRFLLAWIIPVWLTFELVFMKLPHYVLPAYPALAILTAAWLFSGLKQTASRGWNLLVPLVWALVALGICALPIVLPVIVQDDIFLAASLFAATAFGCALAARHMLVKEKLVLSLPPLIAAGGLLMVSIFGFLLPNLDKVFLSREIMRAIPARTTCPQPRIFTTGYREPSLVFLAGTRTTFIEETEKLPLELQLDPCAIGVVDSERLDAFRAAAKGMPLEEAGKVSGFNYGNGRTVEVTLFTTKPEAASPPR
jgi:4-amino-4-deoxy-L-arabinose transferase-like glycosyltransferase